MSFFLRNKDRSSIYLITMKLTIYCNTKTSVYLVKNKVIDCCYTKARESSSFCSVLSPLACKSQKFGRSVDQFFFFLNIPRNKKCVNVPPPINHLWTRNYSTMPMILKTVTTREFGAKAYVYKGGVAKVLMFHSYNEIQWSSYQVFLGSQTF